MRIAQQIPTELGVVAADETRGVFVCAGRVALVGCGCDEGEDGEEGEEEGIEEFHVDGQVLVWAV